MFLPLSQKPVSDLNSKVRMPKGVFSSSTVAAADLTRTTAV
jgi:hypothetical protein